MTKVRRLSALRSSIQCDRICPLAAIATAGAVERPPMDCKGLSPGVAGRRPPPKADDPVPTAAHWKKAGRESGRLMRADFPAPQAAKIRLTAQALPGGSGEDAGRRGDGPAGQPGRLEVELQAHLDLARPVRGSQHATEVPAADIGSRGSVLRGVEAIEELHPVLHAN